MKVSIIVLCFGLASCSILHKSTEDKDDSDEYNLSDWWSDESKEDLTKRNPLAAIQPLLMDYPMLRQCKERHANATEIIDNAHGNIAGCMVDEITNYLFSMGGIIHSCSYLVDAVSGCTKHFLDDLSPCMGTEVKEAMGTYLRGIVKATCQNKEVLSDKFLDVVKCLSDVKEQKKCEKPYIDFYSNCSELNASLKCMIAQFKTCGEDVADLMKKLLIEPMQQLSCNNKILK